MKIHWKKKVVFGMRCGLKNPYQVAYQIDGSKRMVNCKNCLRSKAPPMSKRKKTKCPCGYATCLSWCPGPVSPMKKRREPITDTDRVDWLESRRQHSANGKYVMYHLSVHQSKNRNVRQAIDSAIRASRRSES